MVDLGGCCLGQLQGFRFGLVSFPWHATHVFRFRFQRGLKTPHTSLLRKMYVAVFSGFLRSTLFSGVNNLCFVTGRKGWNQKRKKKSTSSLFAIEK
jgi:hypothetical protein